MKIRYDQEVDIMYIQLRSAKIDDTDEVAEGLIVDFGGDGQVVGIEILDASKLMGEVPEVVLLTVTGRSPA